MAHKYLVTLTPGEDRLYRGRVSGSARLCVARKDAPGGAAKHPGSDRGIIEVRKAQKLPIPSPDIVEISVAA